MRLSDYSSSVSRALTITAPTAIAIVKSWKGDMARLRDMGNSLNC